MIVYYYNSVAVAMISLATGTRSVLECISNLEGLRDRCVKIARSMEDPIRRSITRVGKDGLHKRVSGH